MKKSHRITILFLFSIYTFFGQTRETKLADRYFENLSYVKAIQEYKKLADQSPNVYVLQRLADSYYLTLRMKEAAVTYAKLLTLYEVQKPEYFFKYAQSLKNLGRDDDAEYWLQKYQRAKKGYSNSSSKRVIPTQEITVLQTNKTFSPIIKSANNTEKKPKYTIENLHHLNTPFSDFGVTEYQNTILYSSPRKLKKISTDVDESNRANFLDLYQVPEQLIRTEDSRTPFSKEINKKFHESSVSFSPDYRKMYFTRNNFNYGAYKVGQKGYINLKIYSADFINNKWQNVVELPFCSDHYSVGHPTVSKDGKLLYFVSDMPGTLGKTDIFVVKINPNGSYGIPKNLGNSVNTIGREMFPFITEDNTLFFSSDGHIGLGELDVFESKMINNQFQTPVNLEAPINSNADDFAFSINLTTERGYLSSNRAGGIGDDDIYTFEKVYEKDEDCITMVSGTVRNLKFHKYIPFAKLVLKDEQNNIINRIVADEFGRYSFELPCNQSYIVTATKEYYQPDTKGFITEANLTVDLDLAIIDDFEYNHSEEVIIKIDDIYFDYDKWNIRPDAARELDHIIAVMKKYPNIIVKSTSHTDARGTFLYNEDLSQKRADASVDYIIYGGISPDRITGKGFGESRLTNKCVDNDWHTNAVYCSERLHQANRRTSFVIQNINEVNTTLARN